MKLTIASRLGAAFLVLLLLIVGVGLIGIININTLNQAAEALAVESHQSARLATISAKVEAAEVAIVVATSMRTEGEITRARVLLTNLDQDVSSYLADVPGVHNQDTVWLDTTYAAFSKDAGDHLLLLADRNRVVPTRALDRLDGMKTDIVRAVQALQRTSEDAIAQSRDQAYRAHLTAQTLMMALAGLALVLGIIMALVITRSITRPIRALVTAADRISMGELDIRLDTSADDEIGELAQSMERMRVSLKSVIDRLRSR